MGFLVGNPAVRVITMDHPSSQGFCPRLRLWLMPERNTVVAGPDQIPTSRPCGLERVAGTGTDTNWDNW